MRKYIALVLALVCVLSLVGCSADKENEVWDYPPMVMFNDTLYSAASYTGDKNDLGVVGKIESYIDYGIPTENNQANDNLVDCDIYYTSSAPDYIFVLYEGVYSTYKAVEETDTK